MVGRARAHGAREPAPAARARALRLVFAGTPAAALPALTALLDSRHEVVAVLTRPDAPAGRGRTLRPSPVRELAEGRGIAVLTPRSPREEGFLDTLRGLRPDCCPVVAYGALVPRLLLDVPPRGWVNLHFSLLPAWRGAAPVQHALMAGDEVTGASAFLLEEGLDTGPVLGVLTEEIRSDDTAGALLARLADAGAGLLVAALDGLEDGGLQPVPQPRDGVSLAPKLTTPDARVDWSAPALRVDRLVRACTPAPGAWTTLRGRRVGIGPVTAAGQPRAAGQPPAAGESPGDGPERLAPGELSEQTWGGLPGALVGTATGAVRLGEVRPEGRATMPAADWLRGVRPVAGERLE